MIYFLGIAIIGLAIILLAFFVPTKRSEIGILLDEILVLSKKELNLDDSVLLIEKSRKFAMFYIQQLQKKSFPSVFKDKINVLLGLILRVPRPEEQDLESAIHQIEIINEISSDLKSFFVKNYKLLQKQTY